MKEKPLDKITIILLSILATIALNSCSLSRSIPDGSHLYVKSKIKVIKKDKKTNTKQLEIYFLKPIKRELLKGMIT